jgi:uncharacterized protein
MNGDKNYVIHFYEPNQTTCKIRCAASSLETVKTQTLASYLDMDALYSFYPGSSPVSIIRVRAEGKKEQQDMPIADAAQAEKRLARLDCRLSGTVLWHLLSNGFAENLRALRPQIKDSPLLMQPDFLAEKHSRAPGLFIAFAEGYADTIMAFGEWLELVGDNLRAQLLAAKNEGGLPGLHAAAAHGHTEAVKAFGALLKLVPKEEWPELLAAKDKNGMTALFAAREKGHLDTARVLEELLNLLSDQLIAESAFPAEPGEPAKP